MGIWTDKFLIKNLQPGNYGAAFLFIALLMSLKFDQTD